MRILKITIILAIIIAGGYYGLQYLGGQGAGGQEMGGMPVSVATVIEREVTEWSEFSGRLEAVDHVEVRPRVSGTLDTIHFTEGSRVKKGDLLFTIDQRPFIAKAKLAQAAINAAGAHLKLASANVERARNLVKDKAIPVREYDTRENDLKVAEAEVLAAKATLDSANLDLEYSKITAPISGRIGRAEITVGNIVSSSPSPPLLTTIVSDSPIYAAFDADEQTFLHSVRQTGADTQDIAVFMGLSSEEGTPHQGVIKSFDNQLDIKSGTIRVRAIFDNADGSLVPGLFARIKLGSAGKSRSILISDSAINTDQNMKFVWVINSDNKITYRAVKLGPLVEGLRVIREGLSAGENIVVGGIQRVHPDMVVTPQMVSMDGKPLEAPAANPVQDITSEPHA